MELTVLKPGLLTTLQDEGRFGFQSTGFSVSGCMDLRAMQDANSLVNNILTEAVLEMQYLGGTFQFDCETYFALTGADMMPSLNGRAIDNYRAIKVKAGDVLECGRAVNGRFGYLAVAGGFDVPQILGSKSTNLKCGIGGFHGRAVQTGDRISVNRETVWLLNEYLKQAEPVVYRTEVMLHVIPGIQEGMFTVDGLKRFYGEHYMVTDQSDRMGYRLSGEVIESTGGVDIISDGIAAGSVQVTPNGMPMVLLSDRQTTGGYAKVGTVAAADIPGLVQCMPGAKVRFARITLEEAVRMYRREERSRAVFRKKTGYCPDNCGRWEKVKQRLYGKGR